MHHVIETIREFRTAHFRVVVDAIEDCDVDLSFDDTGEVRAKLESGEFISFCARARVFGPAGAELAADYLGGCIYESPKAFMDHRACGRQNREYEAAGDAGRWGSYFSDMIRTVCDDARKVVQQMHNLYVRSVTK